MKRRNKVDQARVLLERNPRMKTAEVMKALGTTKSYTYVLMSKARASYKEQYGESIEERMIRLRDFAKRRAMASQTSNLPEGVDTENKDKNVKVGELIYKLTGTQAKIARKIGIPLEDYALVQGEVVVGSDPVNNPAHYTTGGIETIDFIEAKKLGYNLGNVVKYIARADYKGNKLEDLRKAQWYLTRAIESLK
jgi:hypothetical protein